MRRGHGLRAIAVSAAVGLVVLSGCSGDDDPKNGFEGEIIQPGLPGEEAEVLDEAPEIEPERANDADIEFVQMMIPHHAQALELASYAPDAGGSEQIRILADRIEGAQRPEIVLMAGWLSDQGLDAPTKEQIEGGNIPMGRHGGHGGHSGDVHEMAGMASEEQVDELSKARGKDFDRLFLELMAIHHQGALEMVDVVLRDGSDQRINELATDIFADQTAEIDRMYQLLEEL